MAANAVRGVTGRRRVGHGGWHAMALTLGLVWSLAGHARDVDPAGGMTGTQYMQFSARDREGAKQLVLAVSKGLIADHKVSHKFVCLPDGVTADRGPGLLDDYMAHHREQWGYTLHQLIFISWMTAFPC